MRVLLILLVAVCVFLISISSSSAAYPTPITLPPNLENPSAKELLDIGLLDVTRPPDNLKPADNTGQKDSTEQIQKIVTYAEDNRLATFFPQGTYTISDTILVFQHRKPDRLPRKYANYLIGSNKNGKRPLIKLKSNTPGFQSTKDRKPLLQFMAKCPKVNSDKEDRNCQDYLNLPNPPGGIPGGHYHSGLSNIDFEIEPGNDQAVALDFLGAQNCVLKNVSIKNSDNFAGIYNLPGVLSTIGNIEITGGKYGIFAQETTSATINNLRLVNQTEYAFANLPSGSAWPVSLVGFEIIKDSAPVIQTNNAGHPAPGNFGLHDGTIEVRNSSNNKALIENPESSGIALHNVFVKGNGKVVESKSEELTVNPKTWQQISQYAVTDKGNNQNEHASINIVGTNKTTDTITGDIKPTQPDKTFLWNKHFWGYDPWTPDVMLALSKVNPKVCLATNHQKINVKDEEPDSQGIQQLANQCKVILLPKGDYFLDSTLELNNDVEILGIAQHLTHIFHHSSWKPKTYIPMIQTINSAKAIIRLFDFSVIFSDAKENPNFYSMHWRSGPLSVVNNVHIRLKSMSSEKRSKAKKHHLLASGNAGGKWYALAPKGGGSKPVQGEHRETRKVLIKDTHQPFQLYNFNVEGIHVGDNYPESEAQSEIQNSKNVAIYGTKAENNNPYKITNSQNILLSNLGGESRTLFFDNKDIAMYTNAPKKGKAPTCQGGIIIVENGKQVLEDSNCGRPITLYKKGDFDNSLFDVLAYEVDYPTSNPIKWDLNNDSLTNLFDFSIFTSQYLTKYSFPSLIDFISEI